jgi:hypothetical protein
MGRRLFRHGERSAAIQGPRRVGQPHYPETASARPLDGHVASLLAMTEREPSRQENFA